MIVTFYDNGVSELEQENIGKRVNVLEKSVAVIGNTVEDHSKQLERQSIKNDEQIEMKTLLKMLSETIKDQQVTMKEFRETLTKVNTNLDNLNANQEQMKEDMNSIGDRVKDIELNQNSEMIDPMKLFKGLLGYVMTGLGSIIIAYLIWLLTK